MPSPDCFPAPTGRTSASRRGSPVIGRTEVPRQHGNLAILVYERAVSFRVGSALSGPHAPPPSGGGAFRFLGTVLADTEELAPDACLSAGKSGPFFCGEG